MHPRDVAVRELEQKGIEAMKRIGIQATQEKPGVLRFHSTLPVSTVRSEINGCVPHAAVNAQPEGTGSTGTVKVADVQQFNE